MNAVSLNNLWTYIQGLSLIEIKVQILLRSTSGKIILQGGGRTGLYWADTAPGYLKCCSLCL